MFGLNKLVARYRKIQEIKKSIRERKALREEVLTNLAQREINERVRFYNKNRRSKYRPHQGKQEIARRLSKGMTDAINVDRKEAP